MRAPSALLPLLALLALSAAMLADAQCAQVRLRKALNQLSPAEWAAFNQGIRAMKANGALDRLTKRHRTGMQYHNTPHFFLMHRALMKDFEDELLKVAPTLTGAPYWDELREASGVRRTDVFTRARLSAMTSGPLQGVLAGLRDDFGRLVTRDPVSVPTGYAWAPASEVLASALARRFAHFGDFAAAVEVSPHNQFHVAVGGHMGNPAISPSDPAFWVHHAYIDLLWALWQSMRPQNYNSLYIPGLGRSLPGNAPVVVYPERWTNTDMLRYRSRLCYTYTMPSQRASALKKRQAPGAPHHPAVLTMGDVERYVRAGVASVATGTPFVPDAPMGEVPGDAYVASRSSVPGALAPGFDARAPAVITAEDVLRYTRAALDAVAAGGGFHVPPAEPAGEVGGDAGWTAGDASATATPDGDPASMVAAILGAGEAAPANSTAPAWLASATVDGLPIHDTTNLNASVTNKADLERHVRAALRTLVDGAPYAPDLPPGDVAAGGEGITGAGVESGSGGSGANVTTAEPRAGQPHYRLHATTGGAAASHGAKNATTTHHSYAAYVPPTQGSVASLAPLGGGYAPQCKDKPYFLPLWKMPDALVYKVMPNMPMDHWRAVEEQLNSTIIELNGQISRGEVDPASLPTINSLLAESGAATPECQLNQPAHGVAAAEAAKDDFADSLIPEVKAMHAQAVVAAQSVSSAAAAARAAPGAALAALAAAALVALF